MDIYDIFFSICLGIFIGGIIMPEISVFLAEMSNQDHSSDPIDKNIEYRRKIKKKEVRKK